MASFYEYIFSISCIAILCGLIPVFFQKNTALRNVLRFVSGLFLSVVIISPFAKFRFSDYSDFLDNITSSTESYVNDGTQFYKDALSTSILEQTRAYILEKASNMNVDVQADITLSNDMMPVPQAVSLTGNLTPIQRKQLTDVLCKELNITKENIKWTTKP